MAADVLASDIGTEFLISVRFLLKDETTFLLLFVLTESLRPKEQSKF